MYFQFTFHWFQFTFNWFQFIFNLLSIDFNWFQFTFNWFQFTFNWFQFTFNWFQFTFNWFQFTFNLLSIDFNLLSIDFNLITLHWFNLLSIYFQGFCFFWTPKGVGHNRVPSKHSYYWVTQPLMGYHLEKLFGCCFFNKGLIRHLIIWKTLYFKALIQLWFSKVNGPALLKERWRNGFGFFSTPKVVGHNRVPSKHPYYWVTQPLMGYHLEKLFGCCFLIRV